MVIYLLINHEKMINQLRIMKETPFFILKINELFLNNERKKDEAPLFYSDREQLVSSKNDRRRATQHSPANTGGQI